MAYFDSPKNRAMWEREMVGLRAERERRANGDYSFQKANNEPSVSKEKSASIPGRTRTSYNELLKEEAEASKAARKTKRTREKSMDIDMHLRGKEKDGASVQI